MRRLLRWNVFLVCLFVSTWSLQAHAYDYFKNGNKAIRWKKGQTIRWHLNFGSFNKIPKAQVETIFKNAFAEWQKIGCADIKFSYAGRTNTGMNSQDKVNVIVFKNLANVYSLKSYYDAKTNKYSTVDVGINVTLDWSLNPQFSQYDMQSMAMVAAGLMIGLIPSKVNSATMAGSFSSGDISKRTLDPDDIAGACFLSPSGQPECTTNTNCPAGMECKSSKCAITPPTVSTKYCTLCTNDADCGAGHKCDFLGSKSVCIQYCSPDNLCPSGQTCNGSGAGSQCFPASGTCPVQRCTKDADCGSSGKFKCVSGQCRDGSAPTCAAGAIQACQCPDGSTKTQECAPDGSKWGACDCGPKQACTGGASQACKCSDGKDGTQTCASDGSKWEDCKCGGTTTTCTAGASQACTCTDGKSGTQTCASDGSKWEECKCGGTTTTCTAGATQACVCTDGNNGSQTCASDGSAWGQCTCNGGTGNVCAPGGTQACVCTDGNKGAQTCNSDGKAWGQCSCQGTTNPTCTTGQQQQCSCPTGGTGTQLCDGGSWGACNCQGTTNPQTCPAEGATKPCTCADGAASTQLCTGGQWAACN
ncbi:MAG: hypothetical protein CL920_05040, partial [Deltaproteobacteria bacterium]|nr:hypothetical protein [Deltaproteobacteria bacterium]